MAVPKIKVGESMIKRYVKWDGVQSKDAPCIICGKNFDICPHSFVQFDQISRAIEVAIMLGIKP